MPEWRARIRARLRDLSTPDGPETLEIADEIAEHFEELFAAARAAGKSEREAVDAVEAQIVHLPALAREARLRRSNRVPPVAEPQPARRPQIVTAFVRDLRHAVRLLAARPGPATAAILTLALGIGANTAIFSVVYSLLLAPLPFPEPSRLVMLWETARNNTAQISIVSAPNWKSWRDESTSLERLAVWEGLSFNIAGGVEPEQVTGMRISASVFPMLGIAPQLGRTMTDDEDEPGHRVVVISDALWRRRFDASPSAIGQTMRVNGEPHEVIGVMPPAFRFMHHRYHVWVPIAFNAADDDRGSHSFMAAARIKPGLSFDEARNDFEAMARRIEVQTKEGDHATLTRMSDLGVDQLRRTLAALFGAVGFVLLIACVNVANLLLAQAAARRKEFTIRAALGASRWRIARQLLAEGMLLAAAGGAVGAGVAWAGTTALAQSLPGSITFAPFRSPAVLLDTSVLTFTGAMALLTGLIFSLAPLLGMSRVDSGAVMQAAGDRGGTARSSILRSALVAAEVALALIVLAGAGLMIKSVWRLTNVESGVDPRNVLVLSVALPQPDFYGAPVRSSFCGDLEREVRGLPGVVSVGAMSQLPLEQSGATRGFAIDGRPNTPEARGNGRYRLICPGYFETLGIRVTRGRGFSAADSTLSQPVVIVSESTAARHWPNADPMGARLQIGPSDTWVTVVGVASDVRHLGLDADVPRVIYRPYSQAAWPSMNVTVKTATAPLALAAAVQSALRRIDADLPVSRLRTMEMVVSDSIGDRRFSMRLLALFSLVALTLAAVGVYGVVSYVVSQRTREIGIRVALGAQRREVTALIVRGALAPVGAGIAVGIGGALYSSRLLVGLLYGVQPSDPIVLGSIAVILATAALLASFIPARRAAGVDPIVVLRQE